MIPQSELLISTDAGQRTLQFDFPSLLIGTAEYPQAPTGATVFWFPNKAVAAVDVRGGAPGGYNLDWLKLGYDFPNLDSLVISGGSWYGLGTGAGVSAALKQRAHRSGHWANLATVAGAIIYDYGLRRLTSYHPDERLGAAALDAARPGIFPLGARGAGRNTMQGSYFGLWLHSGQGGAFAQHGSTKVAAFTVVNSVGVIVDREGNVVTGGQQVPADATTINSLLGLVPNQIRSQAGSVMGQRNLMNPANTTISVVVTNQKLTFAELQRLAVQVHTSMGRMIQPLATANDGDILFAVSTGEIEANGLHPTDLGVVASEVMWSAVLSSVPDLAVPKPNRKFQATGDFAGTYAFSPDVSVDVSLLDGLPELTVRGSHDVFGLESGTVVKANRAGEMFNVGRGFLERIGFSRASSGETSLVLNPGHWEQSGVRV